MVETKEIRAGGIRGVRCARRPVRLFWRCMYPCL